MHHISCQRRFALSGTSLCLRPSDPTGPQDLRKLDAGSEIYGQRRYKMPQLFRFIRRARSSRPRPAPESPSMLIPRRTKTPLHRLHTPQSRSSWFYDIILCTTWKGSCGFLSLSWWHRSTRTNWMAKASANTVLKPSRVSSTPRKL